MTTVPRLRPYVLLLFVVIGSSSATHAATPDVPLARTSSESPRQVTLNEPIAATGRTLCLTSVQFSGIVATFVDSDPAAQPSGFSAIIEWGNGSTSQGSVSVAADGGFAVTGSHKYTNTATREATVTVTRMADGSTAVARSRVVVNGATILGPARLCRTRTSATALAHALGINATWNWQLTNANVLSVNGTTLEFQPLPNATSVTLTLTASAEGACTRTITRTIAIGNCPASGDTNGDGRSEIVWRNLSQGLSMFWYLDGVSVTNTRYNFGYDGWQFVALQDVDADGTSDMIWLRPDSGEVRAWLLMTWGTDYAYSMATIPSGQTLEAATDFNADGRADLLLRDRSTNETSVWLFEAVRRNVRKAMVAQPPSMWSLHGSGDFNGDGKSDLLWRNSRTHEAAIWLMDGSTIAAATVVASPHSTWSIRGTGDVDGDGRYDIIWRNMRSHEAVVWLMNGTSIVAAGYLATPPPEWDLKSVGDFDGDGRADVMWRNFVTGDNAVWLLNGTSIKSAGYVNAVPDQNWTVIGPR